MYCHQNNLVFAPQYFSSDHLETVYSKIRIGRHKGRRTNPNFLELSQGLQNLNRVIELMSERLNFTPEPIARTRSKSVLGKQHQKCYTNYPARSITIQDAVATMNEATDYCSWICSKLPGVKLKNDIEDEFDANMVIEKYRLHIDEDDSVAHIEYDLEADSVWSDDDRGSDDGRSDIKKNQITAFGKSMSIKTAMAIHANGGYNSLPGQSRASRFFMHNFRPI